MAKNPPAKRHEAVIALIYCAVILTLMEYFLIPPRAEILLNGPIFGNWRPPSLEAGLLWSGSCLLLYLAVPCLLILRFARVSVADHGFSTQGFWRHLRTYLLLFLLMTPLIYLAASQVEFTRIYPFVPAAKQSWQNFTIWESAYLLQFFALEFFFRGYLLYTLERHMDRWLAIAVMVVPYTMIHFHKPVFETMGAIVAGTVLGHLSLKYRSWLGGAVLHSLVALSLDSLSSFFTGF